MTTYHRGTNMTEVAQVAVVVAHDVDDVTNENEHSVSDAENKEDDMTHEEDDAAVNEDDDTGEESEKTLHKEDKEPCHMNDEESNETDKPHMNGVEHKEDETADKKSERSEAVNGVARDREKEEDAQPETNEDQNMSDLALKKEVRQKFKIRNIIFTTCFM